MTSSSSSSLAVLPPGGGGDEEPYECVEEDDIELHSEDEDEIPYIKPKEDFFPARRESTLEAVGFNCL